MEVHPHAGSYKYFDNLITSPYVVKNSLPSSFESGFFIYNSRVSARAELYLKPLDIVWTGRRHWHTDASYYHAGIYLGRGNEGKNWMCHLDEGGKEAKIITWEIFLKNGSCEELIRFHPLIPFNYYSKIAKQVAGYWRNSF